MYVTRARSCAHVYARTCVRERVCPVCQESIRGVRAVYRAGESRGGRIDIKIVTEFRRATTYPNALSSPLNYPFSSRVHFIPLLSPPLLETAFPFYVPFRTLPRRARAPRYSSGKLFQEENIVVNRRSKFPTVAQKSVEV